MSISVANNTIIVSKLYGVLIIRIIIAYVSDHQRREVSVDSQMVRVGIGERGGIVVGAQIKVEKVGAGQR